MFLSELQDALQVSVSNFQKNYTGDYCLAKVIMLRMSDNKKRINDIVPKPAKKNIFPKPPVISPRPSINSCIRFHCVWKASPQPTNIRMGNSHQYCAINVIIFPSLWIAHLQANRLLLEIVELGIHFFFPSLYFCAISLRREIVRERT